MRAYLAFLAPLIGCGGSVDAGTAAGSGGLGPGIANATGGRSYAPFPGAGGGTLPETGNRVTGGRAQTATGGQVATGGRARLAIGGNLSIGCPIGSQGCPCYATNLCATPTLLTCVTGICCTLSGDCALPRRAWVERQAQSRPGAQVPRAPVVAAFRLRVVPTLSVEAQAPASAGPRAARSKRANRRAPYQWARLLPVHRRWTPPSMPSNAQNPTAAAGPWSATASRDEAFGRVPR